MSEAESKHPIDFRLLILVVFYQIEDSSAVDKCSPPSNALIGTMCFNFHETKLSWSDAKIACETEEHLLARVESTEHIHTIFATMPSVNVNTDTFPVWVGAKSISDENVLVWMDDGARVVEDVWRNQEPSSSNGSREDCAAVDLNMTLSSFHCGLLRPYLCMHDVTKTMKYNKKNKYLLCHCSEGTCNDAGDCPYTKKCARRWFGPGCQQRSIPNSLEGILPVLFDNDDSTCLGKNIFSFNMHFGHNYSFTWIRVVLGLKGQLNDFQLSFPDNGGNCTDLLKVDVNVKTVDLSCPTMSNAIDNLKVTWKGLKLLCSCYVNGGKNIMPMFHNVWTSAPSPLSLIPMDGNRAKNDPCINETFNSNTSEPNYAVQFAYGFVIREMILYRRINPKGYQHLVGVVIKMFYESGVKNYVSELSASSVFSTVRLKPFIDKPIFGIEVTLSAENIANRKGDINICELEAFGECPNGTYGILCEHRCIDRCLTDACFDTGACFHGERTATNIRTTRKPSPRNTSEELLFNMTSTFNPVTNSTYQIHPGSSTNVHVNGTSALDKPLSIATRPNEDTKTERRYTTAYPKITPKDYIHVLRFSAFAMGLSLIGLCSATGYLCHYHWRVSNSKDDASDEDHSDSNKDSNFTSSKYTSTSNLEESQSKTASASAKTAYTFMSRHSLQIH